MAAADNQVPPPAEENEDVILLTDLVEDAPSEVVLELYPGKQDVDSLFLKDSPLQSSPKTPASPDAEDDLGDLLASLKDLPEDLGAAPGAATREQTAVPEEPEAPGHREPMLYLTEVQLKEIIHEVVQETGAQLTQKLALRIAGEVLDRKIGAWRKREQE
jgi:hypothetical protein